MILDFGLRIAELDSDPRLLNLLIRNAECRSGNMKNWYPDGTG